MATNIAANIGVSNPAATVAQNPQAATAPSWYSGIYEDVASGKLQLAPGQFGSLFSNEDRQLSQVEFQAMSPQVQAWAQQNPQAFAQSLLAHRNPANQDLASMGAEGGYANPAGIFVNPSTGQLDYSRAGYMDVHDQSMWTGIRDTLESAAAVAGNYLLPGSGLISSQLVSKGSQEQLGSTLGKLAMAGSGLAGAGVGQGMTGIPSASNLGYGWGNLLNTTGGVSSGISAGDLLKGGSMINSLFSSGQGGQGTGGGSSSLGTTLGGFGGLATGLNTLLSNGGVTPNQATVNAADPFAPYRGDTAQQYAQALSPGGTVNPAQMPGYSQFLTGVMNPALDATQRKMAATGQGQSGAEQIALQNVGQQGYYNFMADYMNRLASASGATQSPATAVQLGLGASAQKLTNQNAGLSGALSGGGSLLNSIFGTGGTGIAPGSYDISGYASGLTDTQSVLGYDPNTYVPPDINIDSGLDVYSDWTSFI